MVQISSSRSYGTSATCCVMMACRRSNMWSNSRHLLFLKMADERQNAGLGEVVPVGLDWQSLLDRDGDELEVHYRHILESLGKQPGTLGTIFRKAQNRIQDPAKLRRLVVNLINEETWTAVDADLKGDAYESLLQKGAEDTKSGAGQYFTPRR